MYTNPATNPLIYNVSFLQDMKPCFKLDRFNMPPESTGIHLLSSEHQHICVVGAAPVFIVPHYSLQNALVVFSFMTEELFRMDGGLLYGRSGIGG